MAAPMAVKKLCMLRQFSQLCTAPCRRSFTSRLKLSNEHKSPIRLISSGVTPQSSVSAPLDGIADKQNKSIGEEATAEEEDNQAMTGTARTAEYSELQQAARGMPICHERAQQAMLLLQQPDQPPDARILKVAIIGSPNAGKSTLINRLMGQRVCSVSSKVHTTQLNALAVLTMESTQIVLLDTPGMVNYKHGRKHHLARSLLVDPKNSLHEADLALVLVDASNKWTRQKISNEILMSLHLHPKAVSILVLNKVDLINTKKELFELTAQLTEGIIEGRTFALDDQTAQHLGKVDTRPLLSHKYKPRPLEDGETGVLVEEKERGEPVDRVTVDHVEKSDDETSTGTHQDWNNLSCEELHEVEAFDAEHRDCDESGTEASPESHVNLGFNNSELPPTLREYVRTLEHFSSKSDDFDKGTHPPVETVEADEAKNTERAKYRKLLQEVDKRSGWDGFGAVFMISALDGEGLGDLKEYLLSKASPGNWEYHRNVVTNLSPDEIVQEAVREKLLEYLPQEVPYNISQKNELWATEESGRLRIVQMIICHKKSHVKLLKRNIGKIAREAEQDMMSAFQCDVYLSLRIMRR
ncbi:GTPase Era, mitochondrial-like [Acanthaster planci]|uniref:GTPase Era, mitochondrial n=1 Tax=Acanthaster planci TaxID=133434 RepID=A0A8B7YU05_ACAPL|nr:GTPase Era, mitochondrial-like [Acanthaster planci]